MSINIKNRLHGIKDLADISLRDNTIKENGIKFLRTCTNHGDGALFFITRLMENCNEPQEKDVLWIIEECLPIMSSCNMERVQDGRIRMHLRLKDYDGLKNCIEVVQDRLKKNGIIRYGFVSKEIMQEK